MSTPRAVLLSKIVTVLVKTNPKRGSAAKRFALYRSGQSVAVYVRRVVRLGSTEARALGDVRWDETKKFISLSDPPESLSPGHSDSEPTQRRGVRHDGDHAGVKPRELSVAV